MALAYFDLLMNETAASNSSGPSAWNADAWACDEVVSGLDVRVDFFASVIVLLRVFLLLKCILLVSGHMPEQS